MSSSAASAELAKLAHQLAAPAASVAFLADVPIADLRLLRMQIGEALFQADRHHFARMAALAKAVPSPVAAKVTSLALPPLLAARTSELLDPAKAVDMVTRLPLGYLADVSASMDPSRSPEVVGAMPADTVAAVGVELAGRAEWIVMGAFVSYVSPEALAATVAQLSGGQLLRIGYVMDDASRRAEISEQLTDDQLDELLAAAIDESLWAELDDLLGHLTPEQATRLAARCAALPAQRRAAVDAAQLTHRAALTA